MDYSRLLNRAWTIVWAHKFLILLGVLAALGSGGGGNNVRWQAGDGNGGDVPTFNFGEGTLGGVSMWLLILLIGLIFAILLVLWVVATVARGSLIAAVDTIERSSENNSESNRERGGQVTFMTAWSAGWQKVWPLIGIALLPAIPVLVLLISGVITIGTVAGFATLTGINLDFPLRSGIGFLLVALACIAAPFALVLILLRNFAERACMLENLGVFPAYRRGWEVLTHNLGPAIILFLIQIALSILLGIGLIGPGIVMVLCFLLWPLLLLIGGTVEAYFSALWTLAWREWTVEDGQTPLTTRVAGV